MMSLFITGLLLLLSRHLDDDKPVDPMFLLRRSTGPFPNGLILHKRRENMVVSFQ